mmetsp:Transcript_5052/g.11944  ORF Transcript_5052/g.11944 Transcript_5052/m.11944 type:complete len:377 (-) Transcript_5052:624-1754(-)
MVTEFDPDLSASRRRFAIGGFSAAALATFGPSAKSSVAENQVVAPVEFNQLGGDLPCCKVLTGMWQLSGAHGYRPDKVKTVEAMKRHVEAGFTTFDLADHYGNAELMTALFRKQHPDLWAKSQFYTKWVPMPGDMKRSVVEKAVNERLKRMGTEKLDLLQFHWWDYGSQGQYMEALMHMQDMVNEGKINHLALTNFDTQNLESIVNGGIKIVSNQVQYSIIDQRPQKYMGPFCSKNDIKLLAYGTVCGGFLTDKYVGRKQLKNDDFDTVSKQKYYNMIRAWGGWDLFQELLAKMKVVADKHGVSVANVAQRWVIDQPSTGGAIVGARLGLQEHIDDNLRVFGFKLDKEDLDLIASATSQSNDLFKVIGDCGDEYRG